MKIKQLFADIKPSHLPINPDAIPHPVMEPQPHELKTASSFYQPQYNVDWCDNVDAWVTTFIDKHNEHDTINYMFNSKKNAESILLELMEA